MIMSDIKKRLIRIERTVAPQPSRTCTYCGRCKCWQANTGKICDACGPVQFVMDLDEHNNEPPNPILCGACGYHDIVFEIDLGGELDDEY